MLTLDDQSEHILLDISVNLVGYHPDIWQITTLLVIVEAIAHDEVIRNLHSYIVQLQILHLEGIGLAQETSYLDLLGSQIELKLMNEALHGVTTVHDVLYHHYGAIYDRLQQASNGLHFACGLGADIRLHADEGDLGIGYGDATEEVAGKDKSTIEHTHEEWMGSGQILADLLGYTRYLSQDLLLAEVMFELSI